jgi:thymidylate synthase (FAD)
LRLIKPSYEIQTPLSPQDAVRIYRSIERAGRLAWKSEDKMDEPRGMSALMFSGEEVGSYKKFIPMIMSKNHESVLEHESLQIKFIVDRGVSHEMVRHRLASFTQESTRYCNYSKDKFDNSVTFIIPPWCQLEEGEYLVDNLLTMYYPGGPGDEAWALAMGNSEGAYFHLLKNGWTPQQARAVLPNSLKTEIVVTANIREWRHIFRLRAAKAAHPQMREVMIPLLAELKDKLGLLFNDINPD